MEPTFNEQHPGSRQCAICRGTSTLFSTSSAYIVVEGREYRVYYHTACLTDETKKTVIGMLNEMAGM